MATTTVSRLVAAPRRVVWRALLDPDAVARWRVPDGMTAHIHEWDARLGGAFRVSLTYVAGDAHGKSGPHTDTYHGRFVALVEDTTVVEEMEFETDDPALRGVMVQTTTLIDAEGGTRVRITHDGLPPGVRPQDNEVGTRMALDKLAALVADRRRPA